MFSILYRFPIFFFVLFSRVSTSSLFILISFSFIMSYATNVYIFLHISHFVCISSVQVFQVEKIDTGAIYAMKVLRKDFIIKSQAVENTIAEREILRKVRHPFLISLHYAFQTEGKLYLVMDFANGGQLFDHLVKHWTFSPFLFLRSPILTLNELVECREKRLCFLKIMHEFTWLNLSLPWNIFTNKTSFIGNFSLPSFFHWYHGIYVFFFFFLKRSETRKHFTGCWWYLLFHRSCYFFSKCEERDEIQIQLRVGGKQ